MDEKSTITALAALAHECRFRTFRLLVVAGAQGLTPSQISESLEIPANTLSFHLKELLHAGLITQDRQGRHLIYRASFSTINTLIEALTQNCCAGAPCEIPVTAACPC